MKKDTQITIRVASDLKDALQRIAKAEDRSVAYIIERILRAHFDVKASEEETGIRRPRDRSKNA